MNSGRTPRWYDVYVTLRQPAVRLWPLFGLIGLVSLYVGYQHIPDSWWSIVETSSLNIYPIPIPIIIITGALITALQEKKNLSQNNQTHLLDSLTEKAVQTVSAKSGCIYISDPNHQKLHLASSWPTPADLNGLSGQKAGEGILQLLASNQHLLRVDDLPADDRFTAVQPQLPYKSLIVLPLITPANGDAPVGVLVVADKSDSTSFSSQDEQTLLDFADQNNLALLIHNLLLQQEKERQAKILKDINLLSQAFIDSSLLMDIESACRAILCQPHLNDIFEFDVAEINLWDEDANELAVALRLPEIDSEIQAYPRHYQSGEGYTGWIADNQRSLRLADTHQTTDVTPKAGVSNFPYRSYLGTPLNVSSRFLGTLELAAYTPHIYSEDDIVLLEIVANQAAVAIGNAQVYQQQMLEREQTSRLFEREKQRRQLADTMRSVAEAISSQLEFDDLLNIVLQRLGEVVDYSSANVQMLQGNNLTIIGGRGWQVDSEQVTGLNFPMAGDNPNRLVIETQEPVIVKDVQKEYQASFAGPVHRHIKSWLGVPLTYGTNILGLMAVDKDEADFFTPDDADVVLAFANQVAVALQNARLFDEAREQVRQLAALTDVAQSINRALELTEVLNLVLDAVFDLAGHAKGSIWLIDSETDTVKIADTRNIPAFLVDLFNESNISVDSEPFASVIESGEVLTIAGRAEEDEIANYGLPFPDDVTYVPLKTEDGVIGILAIEAVIQNRTKLNLITTLADLAAVAIDSARMLGNTRRRAAEMQHLYDLGVEISGMLDVQQVMGSVINNALRLTNSHVGAILFWDEEKNQYLIEGVTTTNEAAASFNLSQVEWLEEGQPTTQAPVFLWSELTRQILKTPRPVMSGISVRGGNSVPTRLKDKLAIQDDIGRAKNVALNFGIQAILGVPVQVQNTVHGAIFVGTLSAFNYSSWDLQSLSFVANQAAVAVQNAQLVQRLNQLTEELEQRVAIRTEELARTLQDLTEERDRVGTLYQIARELSSSFDLDRILNEALHLINRAIEVSHGSLLLLDPATGYLVHRAALGRAKPLPRGGLQTKYQLGYGLAGTVMETRQPCLIPDLTQNTDWVLSTKPDDRRSALVVPLSTGDEVVGVLMLFHFDTNYFTEDHLKLVSAAGAQIATAVNNAELYRLITDQAERLGIMYRSQATEAAKNQAILEGITEGVLVLDATRNIVLINPKAAELLNVNATDLENQPVRQILEYSQAAPELTQSFFDNLTEALRDIEKGRPSAQFRIEVAAMAMMVALAPVALGAEETRSVVAVLRDISKEAEIDRIKNEFISTVSHELRTPMTSIKGYADLLLSGKGPIGELNPTQHRFVKVIQSNADRLSELVNDILEISRIETGRIKLAFNSLDIIRIINDVALSFEGQLVKKTMNLSLNLPEQLPPVYADKARLTQILVNLIGNAWQYTPEEGNINVYAKQVDSFIQIDIEDNGIGIVEKDVDYIFDRFFRSERTEVQVVDGTGLGLAITKSFVDMLGGKIWVKSQIDVGTTFSFTVPVDTGPQADNQLPDKTDAAPKPLTENNETW